MPRARKFTDEDLIQALTVHEGNISKAAQELDVTRAAVKKRVNSLPAGVFLTDLNQFRMKRADTFADIQRRILQHITPEKLAKASLNQLGTLLGIFYDKERLEQNLSTENIAHDMVKRIDPKDMGMLKEYIKKTTERKRNEIQYDD